MKIRPSFLLVLAASICLGTPPAFANRYSPSSDGKEITDSQTGLIWRRCAEGMVWNGDTCTGTALSITHSSAEARAEQEARQDKKAWRLPTVKELKSLYIPEQPGPHVDPAAFPATPEKWFWTVFIYKLGVIDAYNIYFGSNTAGIGDGRDNPYGAVRLVRSGRKTPAKNK